MTADPDLAALLARVAAALERLAPPPPALLDFAAAEAFVWQAQPPALTPVARPNRVPLALLAAIDRQRAALHENTRRFARGLPANNALLWGARGMGKSSLVKAVHAAVNAEPETPRPLRLVEIHREDVDSLPILLRAVRNQAERVILFCDDLSFDAGDTSYKSLKAMLDGGVEGRPENALFYATSNRRHILAREMIENERSTAIHAGEAVEEKVSLSDRFGLWIGFHNCSQDEYLAMVFGYARAARLDLSDADLTAAAIEWSVTRGGRSGRVAWQLIQDLAGRAGVRIDLG